MREARGVVRKVRVRLGLGLAHVWHGIGIDWGVSCLVEKSVGYAGNGFGSVCCATARRARRQSIVGNGISLGCEIEQGRQGHFFNIDILMKS